MSDKPNQTQKMNRLPAWSFRNPKTIRWLLLSAVVVLAAVGAIAFFRSAASGQKTAVTEPEMRTAVVRQDDLVIYASGTGTLIASDEVNLAFKSSGRVTELNVAIGDQVEAGDLLAKIDDSDARIKHIQAKRAAAELTSDAAIATAQQNMAAAQTSLNESISSLQWLISPNVYNWEQKVTAAKQALEDARAAGKAEAIAEAETALDAANHSLSSAWQEWENNYVPNNFTEKSMDRATRRVTKTVNQPNEIEILEAHAAVDAARATLTEYTYLYEALTTGEIPEDATGTDLAALENALLELEAAEDTLNGAQLHTPIAGTVMSIDTRVGDTVSSNSVIITIANLEQPYLEIFLDVEDWVNIDLDYDVEITFDVLPDTPFTGNVVQIDPGLYTESETSLVRAVVKLDNPGEHFNLPLGTGAAVDVIGGRAENAVLVPVEALREFSQGEYAVFVIEDGEPKMRVVEIGIRDLLYAEVLSGLEPGEIISTGIVETE
ncbi:MAG: efflux RND transporter periplasmic adaptor subunit [Anaerolineales bacterium]|nr:efflux RND transporter periplasmic adaptor subunit [Anaerolineales bacterium]